MKRSLLLVVCVCCAIVVGFVSCGKAPKVCDPDNLSQKAQLCPDRDSLGFAQEFGSGTFIGTKPIEALSIRNGGMADLVMSSVSASGDPQFKYSASWDENLADTSIPSITVKGNKTVFIQVEFAPTAATRSTGTITIVSNAENSPNKTFAVSGCGVPPDSLATCNADGGSPACGTSQRCDVTRGRDAGLGLCVGVSPCYRDGGIL